MTTYRITLTMPGGATYRLIMDHPTGILSLSDLAAEADSLWALGAGDTLSVEALAADSEAARLDTFIRQIMAGRDEDSDEELLALLRDTWPAELGTTGGQIEVRNAQVAYRTINAEEQEDNHDLATLTLRRSRWTAHFTRNRPANIAGMTPAVRRAVSEALS